MIAGLLSFPFLTRMLTLEEYGYLSLIGVTLTVVVGVGKSGLQHSTVRFYAESKSNPEYHNSFIATTLIGISMVGALVAAVFFAISYIFYNDFWGNHALHFTLLPVAILVFVRVMDSALMNIFRAEEKSGFVSTYQILKKYLALGLMISVFLYVAIGVGYFYLVQLAVELLLVLSLFFKILQRYSISFRLFRLSMFKSMMIYGLPMLGYELFGTILNIGDRYVLQYLKGAESVGIYSASYNLCEYAQNIIVAAINSAILPMYLRMWAEEGAEKTKAFLDKSLRFFILLGFPIVAGLSAVGAELLTFLASEQYASGDRVIPYVVASMIFQGGSIIFAAGLYIDRQSSRLMWMMVVTAIVNVALNFLLIPHFGIEGCAIATLISFVGLSIYSYLDSRRIVRVDIPVKYLLKITAISLLMYLGIFKIQIDGVGLTLLVKIFAGVFLYGAMLLLCDQDTRRFSAKLLKRIS